MANILTTAIGGRDWVQYHWGGIEQFSLPYRVYGMDVQQHNMLYLLLWRSAGLVASGSNRGTWASGDVRLLSGDSNVGVD